MPSDLGAGERDRTADLPFTRRLLCQLSYTGGRLVHGSPLLDVPAHPSPVRLLASRPLADCDRRRRAGD
jgi:hypothetical protein